MFESPDKLLLGFLSGLLFGVLLQKGQVAKYHVILGQLLLKDFTVLKIMLTAVITGAIGVYALHQLGYVTLEIKPAALGGVFAGAVLFGIGMSILGFCPGTSIAACGEGRTDAMVGVLGMLAGAAGFVLAYPALQSWIKGLSDLGKVTLPGITGTSPWWWIAGLMLAAIAALILSALRRQQTAHQ